MSQADKILERMKRNPLDRFTLGDVEAVCRANGVDCDAPKRGSHYTISHKSQADILTIPNRRPIKPVYIRKLVHYLEQVRASLTHGTQGISDRD